MTLTDSSDNGAALQAAITASSAGDTIRLVTSGTIRLDAEMVIAHDLTIEAISDETVRISGNDAHRIFKVNAGATLTLRNLILEHGYADDGGAVYVDGWLSLNQTTIENSIATGKGGAIYVSPTALVAMIGSTITGNRAADGGAIYAESFLELISSTISDNDATAGAAAIYHDGSHTFDVSSSTISGNGRLGGNTGANATIGLLTCGARQSFVSTTVTNNAAPMFNIVECGSNGGEVKFRNSIVAKNRDNPATASDITYTENVNLEALDANFVGNVCKVVGGACAGTHPFQAAPNIINTDPQLGDLAMNGGPTKTHLPNPGSPVIDVGTPYDTWDQRGSWRPAGGVDDIGAVEAVLVTASSGNGPGSLEALLADTNNVPNYSIINFDPNLALVWLEPTTISINRPLSIVGPGRDRLTLQRYSGTGPMFNVGSSAELLLRGFTLDGQPGNAGSWTRCIQSAATPLELRELTVQHCQRTDNLEGSCLRTTDDARVIDSILTYCYNTGSGKGGAIGAVGPDSLTVVVRNSVISRTTASRGAGIYYSGGAIQGSGYLHVKDSTFEVNLADATGGAIALHTAPTGPRMVYIEGSTFHDNFAIQDGGAIHGGRHELNIINSTFSGNGTFGRGGAIFIQGGTAAAVTRLLSTTITNNSADLQGGGIFISSAPGMEIGRSIIYGNAVAMGGTGPDIDAASAWTSYGRNIFGSNSLAPTAAGTSQGDLSADPLLAALSVPSDPFAEPTRALGAGSPAVNAGGADSEFATLAADMRWRNVISVYRFPNDLPLVTQNGARRLSGTATDIGASETDDDANCGAVGRVCGAITGTPALTTCSGGSCTPSSCLPGATLNGVVCEPTLCAVNEHVSSHACVACTGGATRAAGDVAWLGDTVCALSLCAANEHVVSHTCVACPAGSTRPAGDNSTGANTNCTATFCAANEYVSNHVCTPCQAGGTRPAGDNASAGDTACFASFCAANQYVSSHTCTPCAAGSTRPAGDPSTGADTACTATICAANQYVSSHVCTACAPGSTRTAGDVATGADTMCNVAMCAPNQYVASHACVACPAGTTRPSGDLPTGADTACSPCTTITGCTSAITCMTTIDSQCSACVSGRYLSQGTADTCATCTPIANCTAVTCTTASDSVCTDCSAGYFLAGGTCHACATCPAGKYASSACGASSDTVCSDCTPVTGCTTALTCTTANNSQCGSCSGGRYLSNGTADTCPTCTGIAACTTISCTSASDSTCGACGPDHYRSGGACIACPTCGPGKYVSAACTATTPTVCADCTAVADCAGDVTCTTATNSQCGACKSGHYLANDTADTCPTCGPAPGCTTNIVCTGATDQQCSVCAPDTYLSGGTCVACSTTCPAGQYQITACQATADRTCAPCDAACATCSGSPAQCTSCPAGQWLTPTGRCQACRTCPAGLNQLAACTATTDTLCGACQAGTYAHQGQCAACSGACAAGQFESETCGATNDRICTACAPTCATCSGRAGFCTSCPTGSFLTTSGECVPCAACPAGTYQATACTATTNAVCEPCAAGTFAGKGATSCTACAPGTFAAAPGAAACTPCAAGTDAPAGANTCAACMSGSVSAGGAVCSSCPAGTFAADAAACTPCPAGTVAPPGQTACTACAPGSFASGPAASCTACPAGSFAATAGATACLPCAAGSFAAAGATLCSACPAGTFAAAGASQCTTCACDDGDPCTADTCPGATGCVHTPLSTCGGPDAGAGTVADARPEAGAVTPPSRGSSGGCNYGGKRESGLASSLLVLALVLVRRRWRRGRAPGSA